ncbi:MAG: SRPBCC family protein [Pseudomonadota bacterium]|nr:SRPBCC family protein [Pseudomonadota bacterium]
MNAFGTVTDPDTVRIERLLPGPPERIWAYLTESEKRSRWLAAGAMELVPGGHVEHVFRNSELTRNDVPAPAKYAREAGEVTMHGRVVECRPQRLLSYVWGDSPDASQVTFELTPQGEKVLLTVTHRRIPNRDTMLSIAAGWHTHLDILADRLAGREPAGFWVTHTRLEAEYGRRIAEARSAG